MANNVPITAGAGTNIATEQDTSSPNEHYQLIKVVDGTTSSFTNRLKVNTDGSVNIQPGNTANSTAWLVTGTGGTFPVTGTFWQATQPVSGTFWQTTQPVSGTFWQATQPISAASLPLPTGAAADTSVNGILLGQASTTSGQKGPLLQGAVTTASPSYTTAQTSPLSLTLAGALRVDASATTQPVSGTVTANAGTNMSTASLALESGGNLATIAGSISSSRSQSNVAQFGGTAVSTGTGAGGAGIPRVTVSNDSTILSSGTVAAGSAPTGNPLRSGALGRSTLPTEVTAGTMVDILADRSGRLFSISPILTNTSSAGTAITTATNTSIIAAPGASTHLRIHRLWAQNAGSTGTWAYWGNGSGVKTLPFYLAQYQPTMVALHGSWELSTNTALFLATSTAGASIEYFVEYETLAD
jgi:hypothetical protein